jgi:hypothetical protein
VTINKWFNSIGTIEDTRFFMANAVYNVGVIDYFRGAIAAVQLWTPALTANESWNAINLLRAKWTS